MTIDVLVAARILAQLPEIYQALDLKPETIGKSWIQRHALPPSEWSVHLKRADDGYTYTAFFDKNGEWLPASATQATLKWLADRRWLAEHPK